MTLFSWKHPEAGARTAKLVCLAAACFMLAACDDPRPKTQTQYDPRFAPVAQAKKESSVEEKTKALSGRSIRLDPAENRILGLHVPSTFTLKRRKTSDAYGTIVAKTRNIKAFYNSLGYQIVDQKVGLRIFPSSKSLKELSPSDKDLAKKSYINLVRDKNLTWSLHIHAPPPLAQPEKRPDAMDFILERLNEFPKKQGLASEEAEAAQGKKTAAPTPKPRGPKAQIAPKARSKEKSPSVARPREGKRVYIKPRDSINMRPGMRKWNKNHPQQPFLD